jgi:hypothetical protein
VHEPYLPADEPASEIAAGVVFWVAEEDGRLLGVMGIQDKGDVALVRHADVTPTRHHLFSGAADASGFSKSARLSMASP